MKTIKTKVWIIKAIIPSYPKGDWFIVDNGNEGWIRFTFSQEFNGAAQFNTPHDAVEFIRFWRKNIGYEMEPIKMEVEYTIR